MPNRYVPTLLVAVVLVGAGSITGVAVSGGAPSRQDDVRERGARVMPFSLDATTHVFDADASGGTQRVVAKDSTDERAIRAIREHLRDEADAFRRGDFADPAAIHGDEMPGLSALRTGYEDIDVRYRNLPDGAEIAFLTERPELRDAVGAWFDAQVKDHGDDAERAEADHATHPAHDG